MKGFKTVKFEDVEHILGKRGPVARFNYDQASIAMLSGEVVAVEGVDRDDAERIRATGKQALAKRFPNGVKTRVGLVNGKWTALFGAKEAK
jgi:hypothetical protein